MKRLGISLAVVAVFAVAVAISVTGARDTNPNAIGEGVVAESSTANPWTNLKLNNRAANFQFAIVTDRTGGHRPGVFNKAVGKINLLQPEFVLSVGDLIEGGSEDPGQWALEWAEFEAQVDSLQMPFFFCPGNHDIGNLSMRDEWKRKFGRTYYDFRYQDVLFLVLNSEEPRADKVPYTFSPAQQQWAIDVLAKNKDARWTFVFFHKPIWEFDEGDPTALGWTPIEDALQGRKFTVFTGHKHNYARFIRKGREYYMLATTGGSSKLRGKEFGEFDHFVWVTMKPEGPVIANVMLDGIEDKAIRNLPDPMPR